MYNFIARFLLNAKYPNFFKELEKIWNNHYKEIEQLKDEQDYLLRKIVKFSFEHVPFYKKYSEENNITYNDINYQEDINKLPLINKAIISEQKQLFFSDAKTKYINSSTGGSTGEPLKYRLDKLCSKYNQLIKYRAWGISGYKPGDKLLIFAGGSLYNEKNRKVMAIKKLTNIVSFSSYGLKEADLLEIFSYIEKEKPNYFYGYASSWFILANFLIQKNLKLSYRPKALFSTSEILLLNQRKLIESILNVEVYDEYGLNDSGASAHECERHAGKHIDFERTILQIYDKNGNLIENGTGNVIATSLRNYSMPFLRYDTGDIATVTSERCNCGRNTPRILSIDGRQTDYLCVHGVYIGSPVLTVLMGKLDISMYRIIQEDNVNIHFHIFLAEKDNEKEKMLKEKIIGSFQPKLPEAEITIFFHNELTDFNIANKHKFIINKTIVIEHE